MLETSCESKRNLKIYFVSFICFLLLTENCSRTSALSDLEGTLISCTDEGALVNVTLAQDNPCIKCYCRSGVVKCDRSDCTSTEGCYNIHRAAEGSCCKETCLGCRYKNITVASGQTYTDPVDPCTVLSCHGGILTQSTQSCFSPCKNPVYESGKCCPICQGCVYRGRSYTDGLQFYDKKDPCVSCRCRNGKIECSKKTCPELNCPQDAIRKPDPGRCCSICEGSRRLYKLPSEQCLYLPHNKVYTDNELVTIDHCKTCTCKKGTVVCEKRSCPRLNCKQSEVIPAKPGSCCPTCAPRKRKCKVNGRKRKHGKTWYKDRCTECKCIDGATHCGRQDCRATIRRCPRKTHKLVYVNGLCCPQCTEVSATCMVFGDPHYRTFDGLLYTFQGTCQYTLAQPCGRNNKDFSIRVQNSASPDKTRYAYTDTVLINTTQLKIELRQKLKVRVNNRAIELPYIKLGHVSIIQRGYSLVLKTHLGVTVIWDGLSYLEVTVPQRYKNAMCGLCGNYNGVSEDDFIGRNKTKYTNALDFGNSWQRSFKTCTKATYNQVVIHSCNLVDEQSLHWIEENCDKLKRYVQKSSCEMNEDLELYYYKCIERLCSCSNPYRCYCQSANDLIHACRATKHDRQLNIAASCNF